MTTHNPIINTSHRNSAAIFLVLQHGHTYCINDEPVCYVAAGHTKMLSSVILTITQVMLVNYTSKGHLISTD